MPYQDQSDFFLPKVQLLCKRFHPSTHGPFSGTGTNTWAGIG